MRALARAAALVALGACAALPACKPPGQRWWERLGSDAETETARDSASGADSLSERSAAPLIPDDATGVEIRVVPVRDGANAVGRALSRYETVPVRAEPVLLDRWRRSGLRLVAVPQDELDDLLGSLAPAGVVESTWWADVTRWQTVARGPAHAGVSVRTASGVRTLGPGRAGVMMRAWVEPVLGAASVEPAMRLELLPVHEGGRERGALRDLMDPRVRDAREPFTPLSIGLQATGAHAFVIVGEAPGVVWSELPEPGAAPEASQDDAPAGPTPGSSGAAPDGASAIMPSAQPAGPLGPAKPEVTTLGEHALVARATLGRSPGTGEVTVVRPGVRVLIVIRPRLGAASAAEGGAS